MDLTELYKISSFPMRTNPMFLHEGSLRGSSDGTITLNSLTKFFDDREKTRSRGSNDRPSATGTTFTLSDFDMVTL